MLRPGQTPPRPSRNRSQAHPGVAPLSTYTHRTQRFQPLPPPLGEPPYHMDLEAALPGIGAEAASLGHLVFHIVGDVGGVKDPNPQRAVAVALKSDLNKPASDVPRFFYILGDVVYFNGEIADYYGQFYEPYEYYSAPIFAIPGNHDGDPANDLQVSLDGWTRYFMSSRPVVLPESGDAPRATMSQPNPYFTLHCPFVIIVGMYTNVPEGGSVDSEQQQWLTHELATAPQDKAVILALHHPIYSFDDHHSGSSKMADVVQHAINDSRRVPNLILTAHVHNYQRVERALVPGKITPFLVAGLGGYYHLHGMNADDGTTDDQTQAHLVTSDARHHGYLTLTVDAQSIRGILATVAEGGDAANSSADMFEYSAAAQFLPEGLVVSL